MHVLSTNNLSKNYGTVQALNQVNIAVPPGAVYGILGPNGSGKTTLLGIVMNVLEASSGSYLWNGQSGNEDQRKRIGTLLETPNFYPYLSAERNLEIAASIKGHSTADISRVLRIVNLFERRQSAFSTYSLGMKQRLAIASALLGDPQVLVLDEPTNGLDPAGIAEIRQLIRQLHASGKTIIMASHILDEVEKVCTHVTIIQKGNVKASGTVNDVLHNDGPAQERVIEIVAEDLQLLRDAITGLQQVKEVISRPAMLQLIGAADMTPQLVNRYCFEKGITLSYLALKKKSLETRFLEITGSSSDQ
ncbi:ABC transporter ATP-binding protein [Niabella drilacis]|uniref:ABC-2 type transport system ATP-binding protein n=1 Tax=Niabella drilacis (strain DSM 25811 / CCM 8410 / CCUG 62505 / LMG 26954 / E90) TaxID=1285928 RepID=A0A1G6VIH0_NIADE|nr:ABC transporter ATP-binding protein [Niabella drilacis]SDD53412.1 ABC-2 type transport system ATP-binding protein [Niabella drilacis]